MKKFSKNYREARSVFEKSLAIWSEKSEGFRQSLT